MSSEPRQKSPLQVVSPQIIRSLRNLASRKSKVVFKLETPNQAAYLSAMILAISFLDEESGTKLLEMTDKIVDAANQNFQDFMTSLFNLNNKE